MLIKFDHILTDGMGIVTLIGALSDDYEPSLMENMSKLKRNFGILGYVFQIIDTIIFPFLLIKNLIFSDKKDCQRHLLKIKEEMNSTESSKAKETVVAYSKQFNFENIKKANKKLQVGVNDLLLAIISKSFDKYTCDNMPEIPTKYSSFKCLIPMGVKDVPKSVNDVRLENDTISTIVDLKRVENVEKDVKSVNEEMKRVFRNINYMKAVKFFKSLVVEYLPNYFANTIIQRSASMYDLIVSNIPGPCRQLVYSGNNVSEVIPLMSVGFSKCFVSSQTYQGTIGISVSIDSNLEVDPKKLISYMEEEIKRFL